MLSKAAFEKLSREKLHSEPPFDLRAALRDQKETPQSGPSDFDLNPDVPLNVAATQLRPAAVLVPIIAREALTVLFTQRTAHLKAHAGQISFPGGKFEQTDTSLEATAFREAQEEINLRRGQLERLGFLDPYRTVTGFVVQPVVAFIDPQFVATPDAEEVAEVFEVPLSHLMNSENIKKHHRDLDGKRRFFYAIPYEERYIWGATAGMLKNMYERLFEQ